MDLSYSFLNLYRLFLICLLLPCFSYSHFALYLILTSDPLCSDDLLGPASVVWTQPYPMDNILLFNFWLWALRPQVRATFNPSSFPIRDWESNIFPVCPIGTSTPPFLPFSLPHSLLLSFLIPSLLSSFLSTSLILTLLLFVPSKKTCLGYAMSGTVLGTGHKVNKISTLPTLMKFLVLWV